MPLAPSDNYAVNEFAHWLTEALSKDPHFWLTAAAE